MTPQERPGVLKSLLSFTNYFFPSVNKVHVVPTNPDASSSDANNLARAVLEGVPTGASSISIERGGAGIKGRGRDGRGWLVAETGDTRLTDGGATDQALRFESQGEEETGILCVTGTVRGARLSADRLVHIPGWGDYQLDSIVSSVVPRAAHRVHAKSMATDGEEAGNVLSAPTAEADDLTALNDLDTMGNEQTWPTEEEMAEGEAMMKDAERKPVRVRRVPKGTSAYQAAWILDEEDGEGEGGDADVEDEEEGDGMHEDGADLDEGELGAEAGFGRARVDDEEVEETEEIELDERRDEEEELDDIEEERQ